MSSTAAYHRLPTDDYDDAAVLPTHDGGQGQLQQPPTELPGSNHAPGRPSSSRTNPLIVAAVYAAGVANGTISRADVKLVDVASGATVTRLDDQPNDGHLGMTGGLLCLVGTDAVSVLDPSTRDVTNIPTYVAGDETSSAYVFGHVPTTGEHKVLHVYDTAGHGETTKQLCEILTLGGGGNKQRWRPAPSPPVRVGTSLSRHRAVTGGVAHFLIPQRGENDVIASFDLATEKWRPALLRCPLPSDKHYCSSGGLSLVELNGCLVFVHLDYRSCAMDMWVFTTTDLDRPGRWRPVERLPLGKVLRGAGETMVRPLMVLHDGRIAFWVRGSNGTVVRVYNPRTGACLEVVNFGKLCSFVGLYRGSLLGIN